jgi:hypothetical protein
MTGATVLAVNHAATLFFMGINRYQLGRYTAIPPAPSPTAAVAPPAVPALLLTVGSSGTSGSADGDASASRFRMPSAVSIDPVSKHLVVCDLGNNRLRSVNRLSGFVATIAGSTMGFANGLGVAAQFAAPTETTSTGDGTIFVADDENNRVRQISIAGAVSALVGSGAAAFADGAGASAAFDRPTGIATFAGNLFVADMHNKRVRHVAVGNSTVTTLAGDGKYGFTDGLGGTLGAPARITAAADGTLYVADHGTRSLRKLLQNGVLSTMFGTGAEGFVNAVGFEASCGFLHQIAVTGDGHLFVADWTNNVLRVVSPEGVVTTAMTLPGVQGVAVDTDASLVYVTSNDTHIVQLLGAPSPSMTHGVSASDTSLTTSATVSPPPTATGTPTPTRSATPSAAVPATASESRTVSPTASAPMVASSSASRSPSMPPTTTRAATASRSVLPTPSATAPLTASQSIAFTPSHSLRATESTSMPPTTTKRATASDSTQPTLSETVPLTASASAEPSATGSAPTTPSSTPSRSNTHPPTASAPATVSSTAQPTASATVRDTASASGDASATESPQGTRSGSVSHSERVTPTLSAPVTASGSATASPVASQSESVVPTATPSGTESDVPAPSTSGSSTVAPPPTPSRSLSPATHKASPGSAAATAPAEQSATATLVPALAVGVTVQVLSGYRATVTITAPTHAALYGVEAIAYTDVAASGVGYATTSGNRSACSNLAQNSSVTCARAALAPPTAWLFDLSVAAPQYHTRDIEIRLHVSADNGRGTERRITLTAAVTSANTAAPTAPDDGTGMSAEAALRSVFSLNQGCAGLKLPILAITVVLFLLLLAVRAFVLLAARDATSSELATRDVSAFKGLLPQHAWVGAALPCHRHCGPAHAFMLLTHVLVFMTVISALVAHFPTIDDPASQTVAAVFAVGMAACTRPVLGALFSMYSLHDVTPRGHLRAPYEPIEREIRMTAAAIGVSDHTYAGIADVKFDRSAADTGTNAGGVGLARVASMRRGHTVKSFAYTRAGYLLNGAISVCLAVAAFVLMAPLCGHRLAVLERTIGIAVVLDLAAVQPCAVALLFLWRWMSSEEADGRAVHDLHPFDGDVIPLEEDVPEQCCGGGDAAAGTTYLEEATPAEGHATPARGLPEVAVMLGPQDTLAVTHQGASTNVTATAVGFGFYFGDDTASPTDVPALHPTDCWGTAPSVVSDDDAFARDAWSAADDFTMDADEAEQPPPPAAPSVDQAVIDAAAASTTDGESSMDSQAFEDALNDDDVDGM